MLGDSITTAGLVVEAVPDKKEALAKVRAIIRNPSSTDDEVDDALAALVELSKD